MNEWTIISDKDVRKIVYCPKCGSLVGFLFEDKEAPKIEKIRFKIGEVEYPTVDVKNIELIVFCPFCGHKLLDWLEE